MSETKIDWSEKRLGYVIVTITLFLIGVYLYFNVQRSESDIKPTELEQIDSLIISVKPSFQETKGKGSSQWIEFECEGYEKRFKIGYFDYDCVNDNEIINDLNVGDLISVKLLKEDILNVRTETFNSKANTIHSLIFNNKEYLNLDCRNKAAKDDNKFGYLLCFIMTPLAFVFSLFKSKPKVLGLTIDPTLTLCIIGVLVIIILKKVVLK